MVDNLEREAPAKPVEKLVRFLTGLLLEKFYGTVTIRFEAGKVTHVETGTRRAWQYKDLPGPASARDGSEGVHGERG